MEVGKARTRGDNLRGPTTAEDRRLRHENERLTRLAAERSLAKQRRKKPELGLAWTQAAGAHRTEPRGLHALSLAAAVASAGGRASAGPPAHARRRLDSASPNGGDAEPSGPQAHRAAPVPSGRVPRSVYAVPPVDPSTSGDAIDAGMARRP